VSSFGRTKKLRLNSRSLTARAVARRSASNKRFVGPLTYRFGWQVQNESRAWVMNQIPAWLEITTSVATTVGVLAARSTDNPTICVRFSANESAPVRR
jgi:hypothetical protein